MKLKFLLVLLGLTIGSYAEDTKKTELAWINPSKKDCLANDGEMVDGICMAKWSNAKNICSALNGRLPTIHELRQVVINCGGTVDKYEQNKANLSYVSCYKSKGFISGGYWSSSLYSSDILDKWNINFVNGGDFHSKRTHTSSNIRCIIE